MQLCGSRISPTAHERGGTPRSFFFCAQQWRSFSPTPRLVSHFPYDHAHTTALTTTSDYICSIRIDVQLSDLALPPLSIVRMSRSRKHAALGEFLEWESQSCVEVVADITTDERASFMPLASLKAYFEADDCQRIDKILCEVFATKYPPVDSEFILREHIAIFCILLRIGQGTLIEHFARYEELSDRRLPFDPNHPPVGFPSPDDDPTFVQRFCEKQRTYCVPIFDAHMLHKHFGSQRLLPIISKEAWDDVETSNGYIIEVYGPHNKMLPRGKLTVRPLLILHLPY